MNEDLNNPISNKRNQYLLDFIRETQLAYNNSDEVIAADFMISQILSIFSPIGISPVTNLCLMLLI
jgi:hypothetical protein